MSHSVSQLYRNTCSAMQSHLWGISQPHSRFLFPVVKPSSFQVQHWSSRRSPAAPASCIVMTQSCKFFFSFFTLEYVFILAIISIWPERLPLFISDLQMCCLSFLLLNKTCSSPKSIISFDTSRLIDGRSNNLCVIAAGCSVVLHFVVTNDTR